METIISKSYQGVQTRLLLPKIKDVAGVIGDNNVTRLKFKLPKDYESGWVKYIEFDCYIYREGEGDVRPMYPLEEDNSFLIPYELTKAYTGKEVDYNLRFVSSDGTITEKSELGTLYFRDSSDGTFVDPNPVVDIITRLYNQAYCNVSYSEDGEAESGVTVPKLIFTPLNPNGPAETVVLNMPYLDEYGHILTRFIDKEIIVEIYRISSPDELTSLDEAQIPDMALIDDESAQGEPYYMDLYMLVGNDPTDAGNWYLIHSDNAVFSSISATDASITNLDATNLSATDATVSTLKVSSLGEGIMTTNSSGEVSVDPTIDLSELHLLDDVTSNVQAQLDAKVDDTQIVTSWTNPTSNTNIPSEKLTKDSLDSEASARSTADTGLDNRITAIEDRIVTPWAENDKLAKISDVTALETYTITQLDTKRDKITAPHTSNPVVYTQSYDTPTQTYSESLYDLTDNIAGGTIPVRNSSGKLTSNGTADSDADTIVSTKGYTDTKDALKIDKANIVTSDWQSTSDDTHVPSELLTRTKINAVQTNLNTHTSDTSNPHSVTKVQVGLGSVENQSMDTAPTQNSGKYVTSGGVYTAIETVQGNLNTHIADTSNPHSVTKAQVGLGNCDNTSDADKPISTATQTALDGKADKTTTVNGHALLSNVTVTKGDVGLGNCDNTSDADKPVSTAQQTALNGKLDDSQLVDTFTGHISDDTYIPSAKLVSTNLNTKVDKTFDSSLFDGASFPSGNITDSGASIRFTTKNTNNNNTGTLDVALPVASGGENGRAGIATKAQIDQIEQNRQDIALLSGKSSRYAINVDLTGMDDAQVQTALTSAWRTASGQSTGDPNEYTTLVNLWNNHEYTWLDVSGESWVDRGISTVSTATNSSLGVVMGTPDPQDNSSNGCIFVESDGTMNVLGWDDVTTAVSNNASDISSLQSGKVDKLTTKPTAGTYTKLTINTEGQVISGTTLSASDIPVLDWSKITTGKPTTLSGYGITDAVQSNTTITGATKCKITYDTKGLVTAGADLSASDIPNLDWSKITTGVPIVTSWSVTTTDTNIPSEKLVKTSFRILRAPASRRCLASLYPACTLFMPTRSNELLCGGGR